MAAPQLSLRGWTLGASGVSMCVIAIISGRRDLLVMGVFALALPVMAMAFVYVFRLKFSIRRAITPPIVAAGESVTVRLLMRNHAAWPGSGASWHEHTPASCPAPPRADLSPLAHAGHHGDQTWVDYQLRPRIRGIVPIGPLMLGRVDPFGLAITEHAVGPVSELVVTPRVTALARYAAGFQSAEGTSRPLLRHSNPNSDELIAREHRPGDSLRRVHWPATARRGEIMVRQEEQRAKPEARLVIDTGAARRSDGVIGGHAGDPTGRRAAAFETAIECVASIGVHLIDSGFRVEVIETGRPQLGRDDSVFFRSPGGDRALLEGLADIAQRNSASGSGAGGAARAADAVSGSAHPLSPLFAVLVDPDVSACAALARLRDSGDPAVAIVQDTLSIRARQSLELAGWRLVQLRGPRNIAECWLELQTVTNHV